MRNRWFHRPLLHSPSLGVEKRVTWLELFYDLIFVAAFIQLGNGLSHHVSVEGALTFAAVFLPLWVAWTGFTFFENRYTLDDFTHRLVVFVQMFAVGAMAIGAPRVLEGKPVAFSFAASVAQLMVAVMYLRAWRQVPEARGFSRYWGLVFFVGAILWALAGVVPTPWTYVLWAAGTLTILAGPLSKQSRALSQQFPTDFEHLAERYGLLTIIVLGESFVKVLSSLIEEGAGVPVWMESGVVLLITCSIWWIYFDDVAGSHIRTKQGGWIVWLYAHIPLQIAITAVGVGAKKAVHFDFVDPGPAKYRWLLSGALALAFVSVAVIDSVTERRQAELSDRARVNARALTGLLFLVLAPAGAAMSGATFLVLITALCAAQVIFDLMMAPFEHAEHEEIGQKTTAEIDREVIAGRRVRRRQVRDPTEALRKGTPSALRRDIYFYLMEGSWKRLFVVFGFLYLVSNLFFAALYTLEPGSIAAARPNSFLDAFFFSVQTMSTIGYGTLSPATTYGNIVVTIEAGFGLLGVALATGVMFAKASRPTQSMLFSDSMVLTTMDGKPTLSFRVGNARGNEIVDASVTVTVVRQHITPEGHHMRRLYDLKLERERTPLFVLTWTVMHRIDDDSPCADIDWEEPEKDLFFFIATITGHDSTYGQTVHARHNYQPDDIRRDHRFVDVISQLPDGRLIIDYGKFHDTVPEEQDEGGEEDELQGAAAEP